MSLIDTLNLPLKTPIAYTPNALPSFMDDGAPIMNTTLSNSLTQEAAIELIGDRDRSSRADQNAGSRLNQRRSDADEAARRDRQRADDRAASDRAQQNRNLQWSNRDSEVQSYCTGQAQQAEQGAAQSRRQHNVKPGEKQQFDKDYAKGWTDGRGTWDGSVSGTVYNQCMSQNGYGRRGRSAPSGQCCVAGL